MRKNVRRKEEKYAAQRRPVVALRGILCFATMSGYPITSSLPPIFSLQTVGNGNHRPVFSGAPERIQNLLLCAYIEVRRDFIQQQNRRPRCNRPGNGQSCHCPCENSASVQGVSYPCSIPTITSCSPASFAASTASSLEIIGSESVICSRTVPGNPLKALLHAAKQTPSDTVRKQISVLPIYFSQPFCGRYSPKAI